MNNWLFRLYVVFILLGAMMVTAWSTFTPVMMPMGVGIIALSSFLIIWEGTPKGRVKGIRKK